MPRKRIPRVVFDQLPESGHCMTIKEWPYWFSYATDGAPPTLHWMTQCSRCGDPFEEETGLAIYWLHRRCPRHRRKQLPMNKRIKQAIRTLGKMANF